VAGATLEPGGRTPALCRDCGADPGDRPACPSCGGRRIVRHAELLTLHIAHVDCDAFYASVEKRDRPELAARPVIVGGGVRGVVSTACYIARMHGVRSAMPMFKALAACPDAVVIRPNMAKYVGVSRQIRALMDKLTPLVEPLSIDEAFLDLSGTAALHRASPAEVLAKLARDARPQVTHQAGVKHIQTLQANYAAAGVTVDAVPFIDDMVAAYAAADLVICRAGAMTVAEVAAAGVAALFVPFPHAVDDHQTTNARFLADKGAATLIDQRELSVETLAEWLRRQTRESLLAMGEKARALAKPDATEQVARVCAALAKD